MGFEASEGAKLLKNENIIDYGSVVEVSQKKSKGKENQQEETSNIFHLFKFTTKVDRILLVTGILFSLIAGACFPILGLFFGGMTNIFINQAVQGLVPDEVVNAINANVTQNAKPVAIKFEEKFIPMAKGNKTDIVYETVYVLKEIFDGKIPQNHLWGNESADNTRKTAQEFSRALDQYLIIYILIGTVMMLCSFVTTICWEYVSEHQVHNIRKTYFSQIIRQDISWYDTNDNDNLPNKLTDDLEKIREGTGYKCAMIVQYMSAFLSGIAVGLYVNPTLTLVLLCIGPFLIGSSAYLAKFAGSSAAREQQKYAIAGAVAEETFSNIKTVQAFCGHSVSAKKYGEALEAGRKIAMGRYYRFSILIAVALSLLYLAYALGFWYGSKLVQDGVTTPGTVFTVFLSVIVGAFSIAQALPYLNSVSCAVGVITSIRQIIARKATIDAYSETGRKLEQIEGDIEFKNVSFNYPSRPDIAVLNNLNLKIEPGSTAAIVGSSGAGKSTIVSLILRFYDPTQGSITIDNVPVNEFNINWLRKQIGIVSQEPVLFGVSIAENIRYGREDVTYWEIIDAAKGANAHDFITRLPKGYDTMVGDTGSQLSGGQKQRIAIARALVRNPKILLLDEATSALDAHSEGIVQEALNKAMSGRTTIIVAHRLSTVRDADTIYVMQDGALNESGKHDELMKKRSLYYNLVTAQTKSRDFDETESSDDETNDDSSSTIEVNEELPADEKTTTVDEKSQDGRQLSPKQILKKIEDEEENYDYKFSTPLEEISEQEESKHEHEDDEQWKVLDRQVATETISDDNDDEYETVVTHVRETREILYSDEDEDMKSVIEIPEEPEKPTKEPTTRKRKRRSSVNVSKEEEKTIGLPLTQPEEIEQNITTCELVQYHIPDWPWLLLGFIGCICMGLVMPIFSLYYGKIFTIFTKTGFELKKDTIFWTWMFVLLAVFTGLAVCAQVAGMSTLNEKLIARIRLLVFENILRQPVGWFDFDTSSPGTLVTRLARNAPLLKAAAGMRLGQVLSSTVTLIGAFTIAYIYGPQLAIILTICVPIIIYAFYKQQNMMKKSQLRDSKSMDEAGRVASETVRNVRTVQALGQEKLFATIYSENLKTSYQEAIRQAFMYSALYAATQAITYYMYALAFRAGGYFIEMGEMQADNVYTVFFALSLCAVNVGNAFSFIQDYSKARTSARLLNYLLNRKSEIDSTSHLGIKPDIKGKIQFKNVHFSYPVRSDVKIIRDLNLTVESGKTLALVGESGCGKSTIISLLERFYDLTSGSIKIDGYDSRAINLAHLRSKIGLVTQEPILFNSSIKDNIAYGAVSLKEEVPFDDIVNAAKLANVHDFVMNLPQRYDTIVGERGIQISGGQKQRVAIARALIRDPKILLLDEATSALDAENEKIVQEALDEAKKGRTCIIVAHRLSTIQNADKICVMQKGRIIEKGTHEELLATKGHYYQFTQRQVI